MAYVYLLDLYKLIDQRLKQAEQSVEANKISTDNARFHQGRMDALSNFKVFLSESFNHKLPKKIRARFF